MGIVDENMGKLITDNRPVGREMIEGNSEDFFINRMEFRGEKRQA